MTIEGLPLWSGPLTEEPAHGLALRQATVNGLQTAMIAYEQLGLSPMALRRGQDLHALAKAVRSPLEAVARDSFHLDADGHTVRVRDVALNFKHDVDQLRRRACPVCLRESAHHRFWWDIAAISSCPRHGILLEARCNCDQSGALSWRDAALWRCQSCRPMPEAERGDLRRLPGTPVDTKIGAMDSYLLGRLGVAERREVAALDRFEFHVLLNVLERVGALHHAGWSKTWKKANDIEGESLASVRATGFEVMAEDKLGATLQKIYEAFALPDGIEPNLTTAYGWFYHWYNSCGGMRFSPEITEKLYSHASTRYRIDRKAMRDKAVVVSASTMAAIEAFDASFMILSQAAKFCGQHLLKVRRIAVAYGLMREEKMTGCVVRLKTTDVEVIKVLLERIVDRVDVGNILGIDARAMTKFEGMGLLKPVLRGAPDGSRRFAYLVDDVTELLNTFEKAAIELDERESATFVPVLSQRVRPKLGSIVEAVRRGTLSPIRVAGHDSAVGLRAFMVALQDIGDLPKASIEPEVRPDFEHWRKRIAEIRRAAGGYLPAAHPASGRGWSPYTTPAMRGRLRSAAPMTTSAV